MRPAQRAEDPVRFVVVIGKEGHIVTETLISGNPWLVQTAVEALRRWVYQPTLVNGRQDDVRSFESGATATRCSARRGASSRTDARHAANGHAPDALHAATGDAAAARHAADASHAANGAVSGAGPAGFSVPRQISEHPADCDFLSARVPGGGNRGLPAGETRVRIICVFARLKA